LNLKSSYTSCLSCLLIAWTTHPVTELDHLGLCKHILECPHNHKITSQHLSPNISPWLSNKWLHLAISIYLCCVGLCCVGLLPTYIRQKVYIFFGNKFRDIWIIRKRWLVSILY
jgi:hypothetical protein